MEKKKRQRTKRKSVFTFSEVANQEDKLTNTISPLSLILEQQG